MMIRKKFVPALAFGRVGRSVHSLSLQYDCPCRSNESNLRIAISWFQKHSQASNSSAIVLVLRWVKLATRRLKARSPLAHCTRVHGIVTGGVSPIPFSKRCDPGAVFLVVLVVVSYGGYSGVWE
uniref:Uncharacterized protein n=1 Tax=Anopheles aquasalis TaxID=42839 RepID=T1DHE7_ANOAQ